MTKECNVCETCKYNMLHKRDNDTDGCLECSYRQAVIRLSRSTVETYDKEGGVITQEMVEQAYEKAKANKRK